MILGPPSDYKSINEKTAWSLDHVLSNKNGSDRGKVPDRVVQSMQKIMTIRNTQIRRYFLTKTTFYWVN